MQMKCGRQVGVDTDASLFLCYAGVVAAAAAAVVVVVACRRQADTRYRSSAPQRILHCIHQRNSKKILKQQGNIV